MIPFEKNINVRFGDAKEIFFRVRTKVWNAGLGEWEPGPYKDLTGYTIESQIRLTKDAVSVLLTFTVTLGNQADEVDGRGAVLLKLTGVQTGGLDRTLATGVWDVQFTEPDTDPYTYIEGSVTFSKDVTRA